MLNVVMSFHGDAADFAAVALLLTAVGIYGVMAYLVALHFFTVSMTSSGGITAGQTCSW